MRNLETHKRAIEDDARALITDPAFWASANSRTDFYPLINAEFSAAGCIDAPEWMPAGSCGQWAHAGMYAGMIVTNRG